MTSHVSNGEDATAVSALNAMVAALTPSKRLKWIEWIAVNADPDLASYLAAALEKRIEFGRLEADARAAFSAMERADRRKLLLSLLSEEMDG